MTGFLGEKNSMAWTVEIVPRVARSMRFKGISDGGNLLDDG
jgi:hypothetical protein